MKFIVLFRIDQDPEIYELIADMVKKNISKFDCDQILTTLVNFSHTLSPESASVFEVANSDLQFRLDTFNYDPEKKTIYL